MWNNILSHQEIIHQLQHALADERLAHAYLFAGPKGIGKCTTAKALAAAFLAPNTNSSAAARQKITREQHPDFLIVRPESENIKIEQIRTLITALQFHPYEAHAKLAVIDDAEHMTESAQNALLKTLEEPPPNTHFVLVSHLPHRLLSTIRSRCQCLNFSPLPAATLLHWLMSEKNYSEKQAQRIAKLAQGNFALAQNLDLSFVEATLDRFLTLWKKAASADILQLSEEWSQQDSQAPLILDLLLSLYRDELMQAVCPDMEIIHQKKLSKTLSAGRIEEDIQLISQTRNALLGTANKQLLFERLLFRLTAA